MLLLTFTGIRRLFSYLALHTLVLRLAEAAAMRTATCVHTHVLTLWFCCFTGASSAAAPTFNFGFPPASSASATADASTPSVARLQDGEAAQPGDGTARKFNFGVAHSPAELAAAEVVRGVGDVPPPSKPVRHFRFGLPPGSPPSSPESTRQSPAVRFSQQVPKCC